MPDFISKLQYKNYERGEYSDEKVRNLEETIQLIKNFPWDEQRGSDVQLTGPSVTIMDEYGNYLKAGLYFNGKFCLYYFDVDHHLYEYHGSGLEEVYDIVTSFFNGEINLQKFEKNVLTIGSKKHFEDGSFAYSVNPFWFYFRVFYSVILLSVLIISVIIIVVTDSPLIAELIVLPIVLFIAVTAFFSIIMQIKYYWKCKNMILNISAGANIFQFGTPDNMTDYNKKDISVINIYGRVSSRGTPVLNVIEVNFIDGSKIKFPGFLIDPMVFLTKFANTKIERFDKSGEIRKSIWNYAMHD
jgi:hypothetical protein